MKMIVFGSTGGTGHQIIEQALEQGHIVTAFARSPEKIDKKHPNFKVAQGDVLSLESVEKAIQGQDAVVCTLGMPSINDKSRLRANGTKNIVQAMEKTGVKRLICLSALGVGDSYDILPFSYKYLIVPLIMRHLIADHKAQEEYIKNSNLDWVITRPSNFIKEGKLTGSYWHGFTPTGKSLKLKISRADVADFMLKQLTNDTYLHKTPCISH